MPHERKKVYGGLVNLIACLPYFPFESHYTIGSFGHRSRRNLDSGARVARSGGASSRHTAARGGALRSLPVHRLHHPCGARAARRSKSEHIGARRSAAAEHTRASFVSPRHTAARGGAHSCIVCIPRSARSVAEHTRASLQSNRYCVRKQ